MNLLAIHFNEGQSKNSHKTPKISTVVHPRLKNEQNEAKSLKETTSVRRKAQIGRGFHK